MATRRKTAGWHAIAVSGASEGVPVKFVIRKTARPEIKGGRYAFGPYRTKKKACQIAMYQGYGHVPKDCIGVNVPRDEVVRARMRRIAP